MADCFSASRVSSYADKDDNYVVFFDAYGDPLAMAKLWSEDDYALDWASDVQFLDGTVCSYSSLLADGEVIELRAVQEF